MKKIKSIEEALAEIERRKTEAKTTKEEAEEAIKEAGKKIQDADRKMGEIETAEEKLLEAKQKQEEANKAYEAALKAGGYEKESDKNNNGFVKGLAIGAAAVILVVGCWKLSKEAKSGNIRFLNFDNKTNTETTEQTQPTETQSIEEPMNYEKLEELTTNFIKNLQDKNINVNSEDVLKLVTVINIDRMSEECPELVTEIIGTQTKEEFLGDAFKVIGTIMDYHRVVYEKEGVTTNIIRLSDTVYGEANKEHLKFFESYVDKISGAKNNPEEQERLVAEFIVALYGPTETLENIEDGIGLASVVAVDAMANHVTFVNGTCQISDELRGKLINYTTAELYISNILANMDDCYTVDGTLFYIEEAESTAYTRKRNF